MAKPKKKQTKTRKRNRRAHFSIDTKQLSTCEKCGTKVMPHFACKKCGNYKGRSIFEKVYDRVVSAVSSKKDDVSVTENKSNEKSTQPVAEKKEEQKEQKNEFSQKEEKVEVKKEKTSKADSQKAAE